MILIPKNLYAQYLNFLRKNNVAADQYQDYIKWLRYFLDFCAKHVITPDKSERLRLFSEKLREKNQSNDQRQRASHAISLYFEMQGLEAHAPFAADEPKQQFSVASLESYQPSLSTISQRQSQYIEAGYQEKSSSPEWDEVMAKMANEIKVRHYSRKTLKTYAHWSRQFQRFLKNKSPQELSTADVKEYLTYLAVKCKVAASTQNQAFNSLLFLFRHALKREFGVLKDVPRAKKSLYIPMVLSMSEIDAILKQLYYPPLCKSAFWLWPETI